MGDMLFLAGHDYTDVDAKADLIGGVLRLRRGSWIPQIGEVGGAPVVETFDLVSEDTNANTIAELAKIEALLELARTYPLNPVQTGGAWLEWGLDAEPRVSAETGYPAKRAWIYSGKFQLAGAKNMPAPFLDEKAIGKLAITRYPLWENLEEVQDSDTSVAWGDLIDLSGLQTEMGTAPGRIRRAMVYETTTGAYMSEFWLGLRSTNQGWTSALEILWELEAGTNGTDTSDAVDATASGGDKVTCSFSTSEALVQRVRIQGTDVIPGYCDELVGRYLVLLRAKVGSSTECGIVMRSGGINEYARAPGEEVYIDNTAWKLIELGEVTIPQELRDEFLTDIDPESAAAKFTIQIDAERLSGSGSLDMDCLYLIPADHFIHCRYPDTPAAVMAMEAITLPDDSLALFMYEIANDVYIFSEVSARDWFVPIDVSLGVVAGQTNSGHDLTHTFDVYLRWFPRWSLFRVN